MTVQPNMKAMLPIAVFVVAYLGLGIVFEYGMGISQGFYQVPVVGVFLFALMVAVLQNRKLDFDSKIAIMAKGVGNPNIILMVLIFLCAGAFVGIVGRSSAESVAYFFLSVIPPEYSVVVMFVVAALVSLAMGTSVGTIALVSPIAIAVAQATGFSVPLTVGAVLGGAMFGDNLSFISDTTIAACQGQGCKMKDKFMMNIYYALPAAVVSAVVFALISVPSYGGGAVEHDFDMILMVPYVLVLALSIAGVNVFLSLLVGMVSGTAIMIGTGRMEAFDLMTNIGGGISGMFETSMVAITVAAIVALVIEYGGFEAVLEWIRKKFKNLRGGMAGIAVLVGIMNVSTANNTVAIVMANPLASTISEEYGIDRRESASILDTTSCVVQGIIPYGAQVLTALAAISAAGLQYSAFNILPYTIYPAMLMIALAIAVVFGFGRKAHKNN
ncbi:MAG: Na+/H+ antiporter NhaC family protein [archaeon]|nr:Na+/H+ antiporter NhaC family protein [archaeon]